MGPQPSIVSLLFSLLSAWGSVASAESCLRIRVCFVQVKVNYASAKINLEAVDSLTVFYQVAPDVSPTSPSEYSVRLACTIQIETHAKIRMATENSAQHHCVSTLGEQLRASWQAVNAFVAVRSGCSLHMSTSSATF